MVDKDFICFTATRKIVIVHREAHEVLLISVSFEVANLRTHLPMSLDFLRTIIQKVGTEKSQFEVTESGRKL